VETIGSKRSYALTWCMPNNDDDDVCTDVWSAGCVVAELLLGQPIFPGDSGVDQLVEIIKVLGTPSREQIREMNQNYQEFKFPQIKAHPWPKVSDIVFLWYCDVFKQLHLNAVVIFIDHFNSVCCLFSV